VGVFSNEEKSWGGKWALGFSKAIVGEECSSSSVEEMERRLVRAGVRVG